MQSAKQDQNPLRRKKRMSKWARLQFVLRDYCDGAKLHIHLISSHVFFFPLYTGPVSTDLKSKSVFDQRTRNLAFSFAVSLFAVSTCHGQTSAYRKINVAGALTVEVPSHWYVRDLAERQNIAAAGEAILDGSRKKGEVTHVSALSVVSRPEPIGAIIRISFLTIEETSQATLNAQIRANRAAVLQDVTDMFKEEMVTLRQVMQRQGMKILDQEQVGIETIGGQTAFTLRYRRSSADGDSPFAVVQFHIPRGRQKVLITLSFRASDGRLFGSILDRVKRSVAFL